MLQVGGGGVVHTGFWWGTLMERDHLEDPGVDGRKICKCIFKKWDWDMDWIELNAVMNLWFP
jgi:hypothetical protein